MTAELILVRRTVTLSVAEHLEQDHGRNDIALLTQAKMWELHEKDHENFGAEGTEHDHPGMAATREAQN